MSATNPDAAAARPAPPFTLTMHAPLNVLLVGVGNRGLWPLEACARPDALFRPVDLCDISPRFLDEARARTDLPASACHATFDEALARTRATCAILCTPTATHVEYARRCLEAGLHVLTEKGMAPTWDDACALVAFARGRRERLMVAQNYRYNALERTLLRHLTDPDSPFHPGELYRVDYVQHRVRPEPRTLTYPYASVWDMSCHHFDNLLCWLGPVADVTAQASAARWSAYPHAANTDALLRFASGVQVAYAHTHDAAHASQRIEFHGRRGMLRAVEQGIVFGAHPGKNFGWTDLVEVPLDPAPGLTGLLADFHRYITEGVEPGVSGFANLEVMALCELTVRSCAGRRTVLRSELAETT